jgi:voltage-gated potassium channel Kch
MSPFRSLISGLRAAFTNPNVLSLLGFTLAIILCAATFYTYVEDWSALDAIYFSVITISTVGYGDFSPQTAPGKIFTMGYVLIGLGVFVATATSIADAIISQRDHDRKDRDHSSD